MAESSVAQEGIVGVVDALKMPRVPVAEVQQGIISTKIDAPKVT